MTATGARPRLPSHLAEVDVLRILTFACVIAVHVVDHTISATDYPMWGVLGLVHFTREVFFALTAFVLVYSYQRRPRPLRRFWPKRFLLVGVPYVVWSAIYQAYDDLLHPAPWPAAIGRYLLSLLDGTGGYHLYFLLVTMQVYLLLPVILWLVRRTRGHHALLLGVALAAQLVVLGVWEYVPGVASALGNTDNATFPSYTFMILSGAVAADHAPEFLAGLRTRRRGIALLTGATAVLTVAMFAANALLLHFSASHSVTALQPVIALWASALGLAFLAIGARWSDRRDPASRLSKAVDVGSDISFGVFLVHPLVIYLVLLVGGTTLTGIADPWLQVLVYATVVVVSVAFSWLARRTPVSMPLTGRPWRRRSRAAAVPERDPDAAIGGTSTRAR